MTTTAMLRTLWGVLGLAPLLAWAQVAAPPPPATPAPAANLSPAARAAIQQAQESCPSDGYDKDGCEKAVRALQAAAQEDPGQTDVQLALAQALWNTSFREAPQAPARKTLRERAVGIYQGLVDRKTGDARPYWELSLRLKTEVQRLPLLKRVVELNPRHPQANKDLANAQLSVGEVDAAERSYQQHMAVSPLRDVQDATDDVQFAQKLADAGRPDAAARVTNQVSEKLRSERRSTRCEFWKGVNAKLYQGRGDLAQKVQALLPYCTRTDELERAAELEKQGRVDEAIDAAKRQVAANPKPEETYVLLERLYQRKNQPAQAAQVADQQLDEEQDTRTRCERFQKLDPATVRAMPRDKVQALQRACPRP